MSGRAFVVPIYKSTYERQDGLDETWPDATRWFTEHAIMWVNDLRRTIDYLATRDEEFDMQRLGYYGFSWGGRMGPLVLAMEERLKLGILESGALSLRDAQPEAHQAHFAPRVTVPVLMLNGEWDFLEPVDTAQIPLFELFGTPAKDKDHILFEAGHSPLPRNQVTQATLKWLDKYLGPVR
jgi:dienelactone hydrolase